MSILLFVICCFVEYYVGLDVQLFVVLVMLYYLDVMLSDFFGQYQGLFVIQCYFIYLLVNVEQCWFIIDMLFCDGQWFVVIWIMYWLYLCIVGGEILVLLGCLVVDIVGEQVFYQCDYYDVGEMIYEYFFLLGWVVCGVKWRVCL